MTRKAGKRTAIIYLGVGACVIGALATALPAGSSASLDVSGMRAVASIDPRFQAYNVEMVEVTGGRFWKPYKDANAPPPRRETPGTGPGGLNADLFEYRTPINLSNPRLRKLAAALGPAYVRVSGTWANSTYFADSETPPTTPPKGFNSVLTREQWKGVVDFTHAANAELVTSVAISAGTRNSEGVWTPDQARALFNYTKSVAGAIAATEFMNEPNVAVIGGAPKGYDAAAYARDVAVFRSFLKQTSPDTLFIGPGSVAESDSAPLVANMGMISTRDLLKATGPVFDVFDYHLYPAVSQRCAAMGAGGTTAGDALSDQWLARSDDINAYYTKLRDEFVPGKPVWITENADAACGGNPWGSTFLDTFRYVDIHARLAQEGVRAIFHNTLASSDYGLLDEHTYAPRPNYWAALLWHKLMGTTVLQPDAPKQAGLHTYAQCATGISGGVTIVAINADRDNAQTISVANASERYTLTAPAPEGTRVDLNGRELVLGPEDALPALAGVRASPGAVTLPPASITFLLIRDAHNASCR